MQILVKTIFSTEPSILTLSSIAPIIDPVSKTYGLSMGF